MHYCPGSAAPSLNSHDDVPWSSLEGKAQIQENEPIQRKLLTL